MVLNAHVPRERPSLFTLLFRLWRGTVWHFDGGHWSVVSRCLGGTRDLRPRVNIQSFLPSVADKNERRKFVADCYPPEIRGAKDAQQSPELKLQT